MNVVYLLQPWVKYFINSFLKRKPFVTFLVLLSTFILIVVIYFAIHRFLIHIVKAEILGSIIGPIIGRIVLLKFLEMLSLALFFMLIFSSIVASISTYYLDDEIKFLISTPVNIHSIFWSRFIMVVTESSWMATLFFIPVYLAFASVLKSSFWGYIVFVFYLLIYILIPNILGSLFSLALARFFPVRQMKKVFQFLLGMVVALMIIFFRFLQPEKLLNPKYFTTISNYILNLKTPTFQYFPSTSFVKSLETLFEGNLYLSLQNFILVFMMFIIGIFILNQLAKKIYLSNLQSSMEAIENQVLSLEFIRKILIYPLKFLNYQTSVILEKEVTTFLRDPSFFSQFFMILAIIFVYGYNIKILPLQEVPVLYSEKINDIVVYLNGPFIGFILSALAMRFVFPSISMEGRAFWSIKASPMLTSQILKIKFYFYLFPILLLGIVLSIIANNFLKVSSKFLLYLCVINVVLMSIVVTALAIFLGAIYANFNMNNPLKIASSYGGFLYMILCCCYILNIVLIQSFPLYKYYYLKMPFKSQYEFYRIIVTYAILLLISTILWLYIPYNQAKKSLENYEPE